MYDAATYTYDAPPSVPKYTGKERDSESNLDNFGFRYFGSSMGRFMSPDEPLYDPDLSDPQKLNLYSYTRNNPLNSIDADGHIVTICTKDDKGKDQCTTVSDKAYYDATQGNNPGINAPKLGQSGNITCGGQVCGHVTYMDEGAVNPEGEGFLVGYVGGRVLGQIGGAILGKVAGWLGRGAGETAGEAAGKVGTGAARATVQDVLEGATKGPASSSRQFFKPGGMSQATADFQQLVGDSNVTTYGQVKVGTLPDGSKAILRNFSTQGSPTLEIQPPSGSTVKIRYQ